MVLPNRIIRTLTTEKVVIAVCLVYSTLTFLLPYRRVLWNWTEDRPASTILFHTVSTYMAVIFIVPMIAIALWPNSWFSKLADSITNRKLVVLTSYTILALCLTMAITQTTIVWFTFLSFGLMVTIVLLTMAVLKGRVKASESFIVGVAIVALWRGLWEIPFQAGQKYFYDLPQLPAEAVLRLFANVLWVVAPLVLGGLAILMFYQWRYRLINFNKWFWIFMSAYVWMMILWVYTGFWLEKIYVWKIHWWIMTPDNYASLVIYKSSKVFMALGLVSLLLPKGLTKGKE